MDHALGGVQRSAAEEFDFLAAAGLDPVPLHLLAKAFPVEGQVAFAGQRFKEFRGEAVGLEHVGRLAAGNDPPPLLLHHVENPLDAAQAGVDGGKEACLLLFDDPGDARDGLAQFGIGLLHQPGDDADELVEERPADAHLVAVQHGAAQEAADDIALLLVAGMHVLVHREGAGADVIGDAAQSAAGFLAGPIGDAADLAGGLDQRAKDVDVEIRLHALHHRRRPLQAHPRVDVLAGQRPQVVRRIADAVELRENEVPNLDLPGVGVIVDFAARSADAVGTLAGGVGGPEVLVLAHPLQPLRRQFHVLEPNARRLLVVQVDGGREAVGIEAQPLLRGEEFPRPVDRLPLEIVAEAEVAQHLEERVVIGCAADVVDVAGPQTFLAGRRAGEFELATPEEMVLELVHSRGSEKDRGVPTRHQHVARPADAPLGGEKGQVFFPQFIRFHGYYHPRLRKSLNWNRKS